MADILDYLSWRGDLSLDVSPFNNADNVVLSQLVYIDFDEVYTKPITLGKAAQLLLKGKSTIVPRGLMDAKKMTELLKKTATSTRFRDMLLLSPMNLIDEQTQKQFFAVSFVLGNGTIYVAFRGTDQTITGWEEDFNMAFICPVPSQTDAVDYVNRIASERCENLILGGHSKGGNLAMYAAAFCDCRDRIKQVYNNDGPGFPEKLSRTAELTTITPKILSIIPQGSVFGMLFVHNEEHVIVKSTNRGLSQHDAFSWEITATGIFELNSRNFESRLVDQTLTEWISSLDKDERRRFVKILFEILSSTGAKTIYELPSGTLKILKSFNNLERSEKRVLMKALSDLRRKAINSTFNELAPKKRLPDNTSDGTISSATQD